MAGASDATSDYEWVREGGGLPAGFGRGQRHVVAPQEHDPVRDAIAVGVEVQVEAGRTPIAVAGERERQNAQRFDPLAVYPLNDRAPHSEFIFRGLPKERVS